MREVLANLCHDQWSGWMRYLFSKGTFHDDGTWTMPAEFVQRWQRQMSTHYTHLSQSEQESDRTEADKFLAAIQETQNLGGNQMQSNIMQFLMTRKFWQQVIALIMTIVVWAANSIFGVDMSQESQLLVSGAIWAITGWLIHGDIKYDWINAENALKG